MADIETDSLEGKSIAELCALVRGLIFEVERLLGETGRGQARIEALSRENDELKAEIRRLKGLPPKPIAAQASCAVVGHGKGDGCGRARAAAWG
jgi:hypothetical protein